MSSGDSIVAADATKVADFWKASPDAAQTR